MDSFILGSRSDIWHWRLELSTTFRYGYERFSTDGAERHGSAFRFNCRHPFLFVHVCYNVGSENRASASRLLTNLTFM